MYHCLSSNNNCFCDTVNYEAKLENGVVISKSDGVEFTVGEGMILNHQASQEDFFFPHELLFYKLFFSCQVTSVLPSPGP